MSTLHDDISAVLDDLCTCWTEMNQPDILALWDEQEESPYLLPQERPEPLIGWEEMKAYYTQARARLVRCSMRTWDVHTKSLSNDLAVALYQMHWNGEIKGFDHLFGIDSRVTAVFRNRGQGWKICHYVEAPAAPMLHLQNYYAAMTDADFAGGA